MSITTLNLGKIRLNWRGPWVTATAYTLNDAVSFGGSSYVCVIAHTSGTWSIDLTAVNWQLMAQGTTTNTTAGDITYYGSIGNTRLPIGSAGQVLTVGTNGYPTWGNPNAEGSVYYVSDDTGSDSYNGTSLNAAFKTLRKACDTITGPATVYVKAGTYNEKLPITVPANVTIIGDGMRNTTITPLLGSATATYTASGSSGTTLKVSSTSSIAVGMTITGTGFSSAQKVTVVVDSTTLTISAAPDTTPSGTLTFRHLSTDASPVANNLSTMFLLSDQTMLEGLLFTGMTGFTSGSPANDITQATIGGVYLRLNPASAIANKSPYIKDCSAISAGGVGAIVDGSVHGSGNKSMVFWAYNIVLDNGVGLWVLNGGRVEAVSVFTYYCYIGYVTTSGGQIRSLSGNNSYGTYGAVSSGYLSTETPVTATVYGGMLTYNVNTLTGSFTQGEAITQATSGATGVVTSVQTGYLYYKLTSGTFNTTNVVTGGTSGATMTPSAVGGQANYILVLSSVSAVPQTGASIQFATGDTGAYVISAVSTATVNSVSVYIVTLAQQKVTASTDGVIANIRYNFSLIRLTGHDFLYIGTGGTSTTNYPGIPSQGPTPANQIVYTFPGRVYYISTDEKGNFNVGQYFAVNQATGSATLNASAFNLSGLTSLRLGSIGAQLGAQVDEFSTDGTLSANSNTKVPTQAAVRTYLGSAYQSIKPVTDLTYDLGDATHRWRSLYVGPGSITLGTVVLSDNAGSLTVSGSGPVTFGNTTITGNLTVNGTTTTINSSTLTVDDKNIDLGAVSSVTGLTGTITSSANSSTITGVSSTVGLIPGQALTKVSGTGVFGTSPLITSVDSATQITIASSTSNTLGSITFDVGGVTDVTANGAGITVKGASDKTITWDSTNTNWTASEHWNIATGKTFKINNVAVLSTSAVLASATGVTVGGTSTTTVALGTNTTAANTVTVGGAITGNILKIASTTGGTVTIDSDVTSGTANVLTTASGGTINVGTGGSNSINLGGSGSTITVGGTGGNGTISISGNSGSGTATITSNVTSGIVNLFAGVIGAINIGSNTSTTTVKGTLAVAGSSSGSVKFVAQATAGTATYTLPAAYPGTTGFALVSDTSGNMSWAAAGAAITDDTTTTTLYPAMSASNTGNFTAAKVTSTKFAFNAATGVLSVNGVATTTGLIETVTTSGTAPTSTQAYPSTTPIVYHTANNVNNWIANFTGPTSLSTGQSITYAVMATNSAVAYYITAIQVEGTTSGVTTKWASGAPSSGNPNSIDVYNFTIIKTGSSAYTVLASQSQFV